jgi:hypothetical protein
MSNILGPKLTVIPIKRYRSLVLNTHTPESFVYPYNDIFRLLISDELQFFFAIEEGMSTRNQALFATESTK